MRGPTKRDGKYPISRVPTSHWVGLDAHNAAGTVKARPRLEQQLIARYNELESVRRNLEELRLGSERIDDKRVRIHSMSAHPPDFKVVDPGLRRERDIRNGA